MKVVLLTESEAPLLFPTADCKVVRTPAEMEGHRDADLFVDLDFRCDDLRLEWLSRMLPAPVVVNEVVRTIGEIGRPFVRINGWPGMLGRAVHELAIGVPAMEALVRNAYQTAGAAFCLAPDIPGMITARILAAVINEAWYTWEQGVSGKQEIDTAMKLGTNYPMGPFEWGERIGLDRVIRLLEAMSRTDPRYTPAAALKSIKI